jgi:hypothetical protein
MKTKLLFLFSILILSNPQSVFSQNAGKKADKDTRRWRYEIEAVSEGKEGTYVVKVWSYSKKPKVAVEQAKKNAIHGVIFQGVIGSGRVSGQPPLTSDPGVEMQHSDFFNVFFKDGGEYMKYVSMSNDGSVSPGDRQKVDKEYKIGVLVSVRKDLLRRDLEKAGVIKGLSSGF